MMFLIERSECDDDRQIRIWWWWCCSWSKGKSVDDDIDDWEVKVLKMLLLIERSRCWRCCCWSKSQSAEDVADRKVKNAEDVVADRKVQVLKMSLLIERSKCWRCCGSKTEDVVDDWRWRLHDIEKLPMIYRCVTLLILMMSPISTLVVVDVAVEYPSR